MTQGADDRIGQARGANQLPDGWQWVRLTAVCEEKTGIRDPRLEPGKPFHYVDITCVDNNMKCVVDAKTLFGGQAPSRARQVIRAHDVIVSTTRPNLNAVALVPPDLDNQICSTGFCVLRAKPGLDPVYLFAFVRTPEFVRSLSNLVKGALYPAVTDKHVRDQIMPFPPLPEQQRIAAILTEQLAAVEQARAAAEARVEVAKALPAAYIRSLIPNSNDALPVGWRWARVLEIADRLATGVQYDRLSCCSEGDVPVVDQSENGYVGYHNNAPGVLASEEQPIVTFANHTCAARLHIAPFSTIQNVFPLRGKPGTDTHFLYWLLKGRIGVSFYGGHWPKLEMADLPFPPIREQHRIAEVLSRQVATVKRAKDALDGELATINALPAALLRRAFNGEL